MALKSKNLDAVRPGVPTQEVIAEPMVRINLNVPKSLRKNLKKIAEDRDLTLTDLILEALKARYGKELSN